MSGAATSGMLTLDGDDLERLGEAMGAFGQGYGKVVDRVLHEEAGPVIYARINPLINPSGRTFKGHSQSATRAAWPRYDTGVSLEVSVGATSRYRYLYFPDDGSSTKRHAGGQHFMLRGGEQAVGEVTDMLVSALAGEAEASL